MSGISRTKLSPLGSCSSVTSSKFISAQFGFASEALLILQLPVYRALPVIRISEIGGGCSPDGSAFATTFKAQHDILTAMGKLNPRAKTLDSIPSLPALFIKVQLMPFHAMIEAYLSFT